MEISLQGDVSPFVSPRGHRTGSDSTDYVYEKPFWEKDIDVPFDYKTSLEVLATELRTTTKLNKKLVTKLTKTERELQSARLRVGLDSQKLEAMVATRVSECIQRLHSGLEFNDERLLNASALLVPALPNDEKLQGNNVTQDVVSRPDSESLFERLNQPILVPEDIASACEVMVEYVRQNGCVPIANDALEEARSEKNSGNIVKAADDALAQNERIREQTLIIAKLQREKQILQSELSEAYSTLQELQDLGRKQTLDCATETDTVPNSGANNEEIYYFEQNNTQTTTKSVQENIPKDFNFSTVSTQTETATLTTTTLVEGVTQILSYGNGVQDDFDNDKLQPLRQEEGTPPVSRAQPSSSIAEDLKKLRNHYEQMKLRWEHEIYELRRRYEEVEEEKFRLKEELLERLRTPATVQENKLMQTDGPLIKDAETETQTTADKFQEISNFVPEIPNFPSPPPPPVNVQEQQEQDQNNKLELELFELREEKEQLEEKFQEQKRLITVLRRKLASLS